MLEQAAELGFGFNLGIECEVFLLKQDGDGRLAVPNPDDNLTKPCYDVRGFLDSFTWLDKVATCINDLGWDLYSFDHEDANGQYEFDFRYADCADDLRPLHLLPLHGQALRQGRRPARDDDAEALRRQDRQRRAFQHVAVRSRRPAGMSSPALPATIRAGLGLTETGYHFIGGILRHGRALCAAFAPTVNSYKRLVRQGAMSYFSWAPVFNSYGSNNRTNSVRVPMGGGRCESRNADGAVNPYLAATLALAAGLEGMRERIDPGAPNDDNLYTIADAERGKLATSTSCRRRCRRRSRRSPPIR